MTMGVFGVQMSRRWKVLVSIGRGDKRQWGFSVLLCSCLKSNGICYTERITTMGRLPNCLDCLKSISFCWTECSNDNGGFLSPKHKIFKRVGFCLTRM